MEEPERPGPDATLAEKYEWMEKDFWHNVAEGMAQADDEDDREVVEAEIINHDTGEVVGTINRDGHLNTESDALRNVSQEYLDEGVPVLVPTTYENEEGEIVHADAEVIVKPGTPGFTRAFIDELPSPFDSKLDDISDLPTISDTYYS